MALDILFFAAIAIFLGWRLYSVLGQRIGHDNSGKVAKKVAALSENQKPAPMPRRQAVHIADQAKEGLDAIAELEPSFDTGHFMEGAKIAREMIVEAFAKEDLNALKPLLTPTLYQDFEAAIKERQAQKHRLEYHFIGVNGSEIHRAFVHDGLASIDVKFTAEHSQALYDQEGRIIEGDLKIVDRVTDIWTFTRKIGAPNPNWQLAATEEMEG